MSVDEMPIDKMTWRQHDCLLSICNEMTIGNMNVRKIFVDEMTIYRISVEKMTRRN
jgi:hypothetical protein